MQTFLPYANFYWSAGCLDDLRLGKQRVECKQIYLALTVPDYGWKNHPAVRMWEGYEETLSHYGWVCCDEWCKRGYRDTLKTWFQYQKDPIYPLWWGNETFHRSHQSNLLRKDYEHYCLFFPYTPTDLPYVWPK